MTDVVTRCDSSFLLNCLRFHKPFLRCGNGLGHGSVSWEWVEWRHRIASQRRREEGWKSCFELFLLVVPTLHCVIASSSINIVILHNTVIPYNNLKGNSDDAGRLESVMIYIRDIQTDQDKKSQPSTPKT